MKVNWTVRFKNKLWLSSFFAAILTFLYTMLGLFDVFPEVTKNEAGEIINSFLMLMSLFGVIIDPTTEGIYDSSRAMSYTVPFSDTTASEETAEETENGYDESTDEPLEEDSGKDNG